MNNEDKSRRRDAARRLRRFAKGLMGALGPSERSILTREGFVYFARQPGAPGRGIDPAGEPDPPGLHAGGGPVPGLHLRGPIDAATADVHASCPGLRLLRRSAGARLCPGERPEVVCRTGRVHRRFGDPGGSFGLGAAA